MMDSLRNQILNVAELMPLSCGHSISTGLVKLLRRYPGYTGSFNIKQATHQQIH
ncbi:MAG: hypothetical protein ACI9NY_001848 [Kiritimatiellia bacterium]